MTSPGRSMRSAPGVPNAPIHASLVKTKYGDDEPRQPTPNANRGDTSPDRRLTGTRTRCSSRTTAGRLDMAGSNVRIANETWEAPFRAQATIGLELVEGDVWGELVPREYGVLYALSAAQEGSSHHRASRRRLALATRHVTADRTPRSPWPRRTDRRPRRRPRVPRPPYRRGRS